VLTTLTAFQYHLDMKDLKVLATDVFRKLQAKGYQAVFAGGCVRDMLMGRTPTDYDVATNGTPDDVCRIFPKAKLVGAHFGVVIVVMDSHQFEVATFRAEGEYLDGRHPSAVTFTTAEGDVRRRDFTVNGLLYDPVADKVLDYVGGEADIKARLVRVIGDPRARFAEDHLRLLRAVRFAAFLDFEIEAVTRKAILEMTPKIKTVSAERVAEELKKLLTRHGASRGLKLLHEVGLLREIMPEVEAMVGIEQPPTWHPEGDVFTHTALTLSFLENPSFDLAMGALLHDVGKPITIERGERIRYPYHESVGAEIADKICHRLKLSTESRERIVWLVKRHMVFVGADKMRLSTLKRLFASPGYDDLLALHKADALASTNDLSMYDYCVEMRRKLGEVKISPSPLITGDDLIAMGLAPGPLFKEILSRVREEQLEEKLHTRDAALARARQLAGEMPPQTARTPQPRKEKKST
jgi:poly(A) polymerase